MAQENKKVGFGVIGCGRVFNRAHGPMLNGKLSSLKAVFDPDIKAAKEAASKFGCEVKTSLGDLLQDPDISVVNICTPHDTHTELIVKVLDAGKYCLCEKPLCLTEQEAAKIASHQNIDKLFTLYQNRFNTAVRFLSDIVRKGELGQLRLCSVALRWWRPDDYFVDWHGQKKRVGGMLFNQAAHILDIMRMVCGEAESVHNITRTFRNGTDVDDVSVANVLFKNGIVGNVEVTTYARPKDWEVSILVVGDKGVVKIGGLSVNEVEYAAIEGKDVSGARQQYSEEIPDGYGNSHPRVFEALSAYILKGEWHPCLVSGKEGTETSKFITKFYE
ncbi:MAG: Gfo/Idh/MocA family oxidoreductase [Patescibacteria group bacterium]